MTALILAGHGSHISPHTAGLIWRYVDHLRAQGIADEITACFWKEPPSFHDVLHTVRAREVVVVPVFTAQGYFTQTVIPAEMGLSGAFTLRDGRTIYYARTLGEHPALQAIVRQRVIEILQAAALDPRDVTVAVIGHGTERSIHSRDAARQQADQLRAEGLAAEVVAVYLDDDPPIHSLYETVRAPVIIAVPFFLAPGSHVTRDVPRVLGLAPGQTAAAVRGKCVYYTDPVGTDETICGLIVDLARECLPLEGKAAPPDDWRGFPVMGQADLWDAVQSAGKMEFGQLRLTTSEVRPVHGDTSAEPITTPAALRQRVRENPFRPLPTTRDLPGGWRVKVTAPHVLGAVVETVYPGALAAWAHQRRGIFIPGSLHELSARQTGIFKNTARLPAETIEHTVMVVCGNCVRFPAWHRPGEGAIPCGEPCNMWLNAAKDKIL